VHLPKIEVEITHGARLTLSLTAIIVLNLPVIIDVTVNSSLSIELMRLILPRKDANDVLTGLYLEVVLQSSARRLGGATACTKEFFMLLTKIV